MPSRRGKTANLGWQYCSQCLVGKIVLPGQELWPRGSAPGILGKPVPAGPQGSAAELDVQVGYMNAFTEDEKKGRNSNSTSKDASLSPFLSVWEPGARVENCLSCEPHHTPHSHFLEFLFGDYGNQIHSAHHRVPGKETSNFLILSKSLPPCAFTLVLDRQT